MSAAYHPHEYQQAAIKFELSHPKCLMALEMGLGKTSITLKAICELLDEFAINRVLIIAPKLVAEDVWKREAQKWDFSQGLTIAVAVGTETQRREAVDSHADITCINRENVVWLTKYLGQKWNYDMLVIDESSSFKSSTANRFKALRKYTPLCRRVVLLTGTPRPRSIEDLWPQIYLLDHGERLERTMSAFRARYEEPGRRNGVQVWEWKPRQGSEQDIYRKISDVSMSMTADDWLSVPEQTVVDHYIYLGEDLMKQYKSFAREQLIQVETPEMHLIAASNAGVLAGKLCQFTSGVLYDEDGSVREVHDLKVQALKELLDLIEDAHDAGPVLVFYWFKADLERLQKAIPMARVMEGEQTITDWNAGRIPVLLAQPSSMGHGLNLQDGGNTIIWYGLTWSLEVWLQANARLHRQGQSQKVMVHRIVARGTVDEDIVRSLEGKDRGEKDLIEHIKNRIKSSS